MTRVLCAYLKASLLNLITSRRISRRKHMATNHCTTHPLSILRQRTITLPPHIQPQIRRPRPQHPLQQRMLRLPPGRQHRPAQVLEHQRHWSHLFGGGDFGEAALELLGEDETLLGVDLAQVDHVVLVGGEVEGGVAVGEEAGDAFHVGEGAPIGDGVDEEEAVGPVEGLGGGQVVLALKETKMGLLKKLCHSGKQL